MEKIFCLNDMHFVFMCTILKEESFICMFLFVGVIMHSKHKTEIASDVIVEHSVLCWVWQHFCFANVISVFICQ